MLFLTLILFFSFETIASNGDQPQHLFNVTEMMMYDDVSLVMPEVPIGGADPNDNVVETYEVQIVYLVPYGVAPRDEWGTLLTVIENDLKEFYSYHLGRTFATTTSPPLMIQSRWRPPDILNGTHFDVRHISADGTPIHSLNVWQHAFETLYKVPPRNFQYVWQKVAFIFVTEIDEWVARGGEGLSSHAAQDVANYLGWRVFNKIYPFDHESGHLFGLHHSSNTVDCLNGRGFDVVERDSFMTQPPNPWNFNRNRMAEYEKRLLTNSSYAPQCLSALGSRPHPSKYLSVCTNKPNFDGEPRISLIDLVALLVNWGRCAYVLCPKDLNCDGIVDTNDLVVLIIRWNTLV